MGTVNIHEAKTNFSRLLERARRGERIVIAKAGVPIAELGPLSKTDIVFGALTGTVEIDYDAFAAADEELATLWDDLAQQ